MPSELPGIIRAWAREPAVPDPPERVWRDWAVVCVASAAALTEALLRVDDEWVTLGVGWRIAATVAFFAGVPPALWWRRTRPLASTAYGFAVTMGFSVVVSVVEGVFSGLISGAAILIVVYALYRWGSGRAGVIGLGILLAAWFIGNVADPDAPVSEWIGGFVVLSVPVMLGLMVRYGKAAQERSVREVQAREREALARELHDTVAHHVSAIAVQAQAAKAIAADDPDRAFGILSVIETQASRTLAEMRAIVGTLRDGEADLTPQQTIDDLPRLAGHTAGGLPVHVDLDGVDDVGPAAGAAVFRIAQESVTNAVRHARHATRVDIVVRVVDGEVLLTVTDDGRDAGPVGPGYGLLGMAERAHLLGGTFAAGSADDGGWQVRATMPAEVHAPGGGAVTP